MFFSIFLCGCGWFSVLLTFRVAFLSGLVIQCGLYANYQHFITVIARQTDGFIGDLCPASLVTYAQLPGDVLPGFHEAPLTAFMQIIIGIMPLLIPYMIMISLGIRVLTGFASAATTSSGWKCRGQAGTDGAWRCSTCRTRAAETTSWGVR